MSLSSRRRHWVVTTREGRGHDEHEVEGVEESPSKDVTLCIELPLFFLSLFCNITCQDEWVGVKVVHMYFNPQNVWKVEDIDPCPIKEVFKGLYDERRESCRETMGEIDSNERRRHHLRKTTLIHVHCSFPCDLFFFGTFFRFLYDSPFTLSFHRDYVLEPCFLVHVHYETTETA